MFERAFVYFFISCNIIFYWQKNIFLLTSNNYIIKKTNAFSKELLKTKYLRQSTVQGSMKASKWHTPSFSERHKQARLFLGT